MNAHQRKIKRDRMVAEVISAIERMDAKDIAETVKRNLLLEMQVARFSSHTMSRYKLTEHGGNWFHLVPADEFAAKYLLDNEE